MAHFQNTHDTKIWTVEGRQFEANPEIAPNVTSGAKKKASPKVCPIIKRAAARNRNPFVDRAASRSEAGSKRNAADKASRAEAEAVIQRWNDQLALGGDMLWSPTIRAALLAETP
jgi:hypothetical protein